MLIEIILLFATLFGLLYWRQKSRGNYWKNQGVPQDEVNPFPYGNSPASNYNVVTNKRNVSDEMLDFYRRTKEHKVYGTYGILGVPILMINDLDILKNIMVKDFSHFVNRNAMSFTDGPTITDQVWNNMMSLARDERWKTSRNTFTPIFTSGKMKVMVQFIEKVSSDLAKESGKIADAGKPVDLKKLLSKFSMDGIAACAFGMDAKSFSEEESTFVKNAKGIFVRSGRDMTLAIMCFLPVLGKIVNALRIPVMRPKETKFFYDVIINVLKERKESGIQRNDLVDMMVAALKSEQGEKGEVDEIMVVATAVIFLVAGYDTTSTTLAFIMYELAMNEEIQERLQEEIDSACADADGKMPDYNTVMEMEYLDMVIHEALRLHSPVGGGTRGVNEDYIIPGTEIKIKKGTEVHFATLGFHRDGRYYDTPDQFNPEHFTKEAKAKRHPFAFQAFGHGPRNCIGMRFALLEAKMALIGILSRYNFRTCSETPKTPKLDPSAFLGTPLDDLLVKIERRSSPSMEAC